MCCSYWVVYTTGTWAADGRVYTREAFTAPGGVYHSTWVWAAPGRVWTTVACAALVLIYTTDAFAAIKLSTHCTWASPGLVFTTESCAASGWVSSIEGPSWTGSCLYNNTLHVLLLDLSIYEGLLCTQMCLHTGAWASPRRVYTTGSCAAPGHVSSTGALAEPGLCPHYRVMCCT